MRRVMMFAGAVALMACGADHASAPVVDPPVTQNAAALLGDWSQQSSVPGASFTFTVTAHDSTVSGVGHYSIEAGRSGTISFTGVAGVAKTTLDFVFDYGTELHFEGPPVTGSVLDGYMKYGPPASLSPSFAVRLIKQ